MQSKTDTLTLSGIEAEIQRLQQARVALEEQQQRLRVEELNTLADAFARKLQSAGFSISEGIAALRPYGRVRMMAKDSSPAAAPQAPAPRKGTPVTPAPSARNQVIRAGNPLPPQRHQPAPRPTVTDGLTALHRRAFQVLGDDAQGWLRRPHPLLGGQTPTQTATTPQGLQRVNSLLTAYANGA